MPNVSFTEPVQEFAQRQLKTGTNANVSEVVRAGMRLLMEKDGARQFYALKAGLEAAAVEAEQGNFAEFDPSIAPGTGTPVHGGFTYYEVLELMGGLTKQGSIVGLDLVEVAPDYDQTGTTSILAAQILMNTIGRMLHNRTD